jgi:hypothetical protein
MRKSKNQAAPQQLAKDTKLLVEEQKDGTLPTVPGENGGQAGGLFHWII